jgi:hypothetical protein
MFDWLWDWLQAPVRVWHLLAFGPIVWVFLRGYIWRTHQLVAIDEEFEKPARLCEVSKNVNASCVGRYKTWRRI